MERNLVISSQSASINEVRLFLKDIFEEFSLEKELFNRVFLVLSEAVNNSIFHGNKLDSNKSVFIEFSLIENRILISVEDEGDGFCIDNIEDPTCLLNLKRENGRGIFLIRQFADEVMFLKDGRKVLIKFNL